MYGPKASFCCCLDCDSEMEILVALIFVAFHQSLALATKHQGLITLNNGVVMPQLAAGNLHVALRPV